MLIVAKGKQSPNLIVLDFDGEVLNLSANTPDLGVAQEEVAMVYQGEPLKIAFNGRYLLDSLSALDCEEIDFDLQDDARSSVIRVAGDNGYRYVVMPMRSYADPAITRY